MPTTRAFFVPTRRCRRSPSASARRSPPSRRSRFENAAPWDTMRRLNRVLRQWFTRHAVSRRQPPAELVLDIDSTDDPTHGQQELSFFNGHYDEHMYHPPLVFAAGYLLGARLRPGD